MSDTHLDSTDVAELERQRDAFREAYYVTLRRLEELKTAARHYLERTYWRGNGERLAALVGYQHPCEPDAKADGRAWED